MRQTALLAFGCLAFEFLLAASPAQAQVAPQQPVQIFPPAMPMQPKGEARITVTYNTSHTLPRDPDAGTLLVAQSGAHRTIYEIAGQECKVLIETIAAECRIVNVYISSNVQQRAATAGGEAGPSLFTNGTIALVIKPKEETPGSKL